MASIEQIADFITDIEGRASRGILKADFANALFSLAEVGGTMYGNDLTQAVTAVYTPFTAYSASIDTKGLSEDLINGRFNIGVKAGGVYAVDAVLSLRSPANGRIDIALTKNAALTPFTTGMDFTANQIMQIALTGTGQLADGNTIGLGIKGSGSATIDVISSQYRARRI